jgi:hypothetical protein
MRFWQMLVLKRVRSFERCEFRVQPNRSARRFSSGAPLKAALDGTARRALQIVTNEGHPFTSTGFRASFRAAQARAGIKGVTFHDPGTAVMLLAVAGATEIEIAAITGHSISEAKSILDRHYLGRVAELGERAIRKLEKRTEILD